MKNFDNWNILKKKIDSKNDKEIPDFSEKEIWWGTLGCNVGVEADGKNETFERPILILRKYNKYSFLGLPLTTRGKDSDFYYKLPKHNNVDGWVVLSQSKTCSAKRLSRRLYQITKEDFEKIIDSYKKINFK
jgi:mRNA-degrading endonuclease toxin of MazEF toxin-antitoxin module